MGTRKIGSQRTTGTDKRRTEPRQKTRTSKRAHNEQTKIAAVTAGLLANRDHPLGIQAHTAACTAIGERIHLSTLEEWYKLYRVQVEASLPAPATLAEVVGETAPNFINAWVTVQRKALARLSEDEVINKAEARDLAVVGGISADQMRKAIGISTEDVELFQSFIRVMDTAALDGRNILRNMTQTAQAKLQTLLLSNQPIMLSPGDND